MSNEICNRPALLMQMRIIKSTAFLPINGKNCGEHTEFDGFIPLHLEQYKNVRYEKLPIIEYKTLIFAHKIKKKIHAETLNCR